LPAGVLHTLQPAFSVSLAFGLGSSVEVSQRLEVGLGSHANWEVAGLEATAFAEKELKFALEVRWRHIDIGNACWAG
jgi:hypothetical protein